MKFVKYTQRKCKINKVRVKTVKFQRKINKKIPMENPNVTIEQHVNIFKDEKAENSQSERNCVRCRYDMRI